MLESHIYMFKVWGIQNSLDLVGTMQIQEIRLNGISVNVERPALTFLKDTVRGHALRNVELFGKAFILPDWQRTISEAWGKKSILFTSMRVPYLGNVTGKFKIASYVHLEKAQSKEIAVVRLASVEEVSIA